MSDKDYLAQEGLRSMIMDDKSRKDIVAGGLGDYLWQGQVIELDGCCNGKLLIP